MKPEWGDPSKFQLNPAFNLGFPEFTDPDFEHYATLLEGISDLDVLFGNDPLKPERPPSKRFKQCAYFEEATSAASALKDVINHKQFGTITIYLTRERESCTWCDPVHYRSQYTLGCEELNLMSHKLFGCKPTHSLLWWNL